MTGKNKIALTLGLIGAAGIAVAFYLQAQANSKAAVSELLGQRASGSPGPWVVGALGAVCLVAAIVAALWPEPKAPATVPGWYDDPESPALLRYRDESGWTDRTASKGSGE